MGQNPWLILNRGIGSENECETEYKIGSESETWSKIECEYGNEIVCEIRCEMEVDI